MKLFLAVTISAFGLFAHFYFVSLAAGFRLIILPKIQKLGDDYATPPNRQNITSGKPIGTPLPEQSNYLCDGRYLLIYQRTSWWWYINFSIGMIFLFTVVFSILSESALLFMFALLFYSYFLYKIASYPLRTILFDRETQIVHLPDSESGTNLFFPYSEAGFSARVSKTKDTTHYELVLRVRTRNVKQPGIKNRYNIAFDSRETMGIAFTSQRLQWAIIETFMDKRNSPVDIVALNKIVRWFSDNNKTVFDFHDNFPHLGDFERARREITRG